MNIRELRNNWDYLGRRDPLWAVLTVPEKRGNRWSKEEFFNTGKEEIDTLLSYLASKGLLPSCRRALDFGCGVGRLTQALGEHFEEVWGVDIAPSMVEEAIRHNKYPNRCRFHINRGGNLLFVSDEHFDFIISLIALQHIPPHYSIGYLKEFLRVLRSGGLLVFQLPSEPTPLYVEVLKKRRTRDQIKAFLPSRVLRAYHVLRDRDYLSQLIQTYPIEKEKVVSLLAEIGGDLVDIKEDGRAGPHMVSYQYCVRKKRA